MKITLADEVCGVDPDGHYIRYLAFEAQIISKGCPNHLTEKEYADLVPGYRMIAIKNLEAGDNPAVNPDDYLAVYYLRCDQIDAPLTREAGAIQ
jgi:hypothetical protein